MSDPRKTKAGGAASPLHRRSLAPERLPEFPPRSAADVAAVMREREGACRATTAARGFGSGILMAVLATAAGGSRHRSRSAPASGAGRTGEARRVSRAEGDSFAGRGTSGRICTRGRSHGRTRDSAAQSRDRPAACAGARRRGCARAAAAAGGRNGGGTHAGAGRDRVGRA